MFPEGISPKLHPLKSSAQLTILICPKRHCCFGQYPESPHRETSRLLVEDTGFECNTQMQDLYLDTCRVCSVRFAYKLLPIVERLYLPVKKSCKDQCSGAAEIEMPWQQETTMILHYLATQMQRHQYDNVDDHGSTIVLSMKLPMVIT